MTTHRPPVIPEIAKAYENDPRTKMALAAAAAGSSTAPVAQGGYAYADGIARVLQGALGGYQNNKQADAYAKDQADLLALRKTRGVDGLTGAPAAPAVPTAPPVPLPSGMRSDDYAGAASQIGNGASAPDDYAAAAAAQLGAPPAPSAAPPGPPPIPTAPVPQPQGAGPGARRPFGPSAAPAANVPSFITAPVADEVPDAPAPVARPVAPQAEGPTKSRMLNAAYRIMADANPYESAGGQDMYGKGLEEQTALDEKAGERKQHLSDMAYQTDSQIYAQAMGEDRSAKYAARAAVVKGNQDAKDKYAEMQFQHGEKSADRANQVQLERMRMASAIAVERLKQQAAADAVLSPDAIKFSASQLLAGDPSGMAGIGRSAAGIRNSVAIRNEMFRQAQERGMSPEQLAHVNAQFFGMKAEARAAGTRVGATDVATSEVPPLAEEAKYRHAALMAQGNLVPWNKAVQMVQRNTSSPELARAVSVNQAVVNAYGRSFGTGVLSLRAVKDAEKQLETAWGTPAYEGALDQIVRNTAIERKGASAALHGIGGDSGGTGGGAVPPRRPGETPAQYIARTGG